MRPVAFVQSTDFATEGITSVSQVLCYWLKPIGCQSDLLSAVS